jgi:Transposase DDE domain
VAQAIMGIPSDRRFLAVARKRLGHLFSELPQQPGYFKRRRRCADTLEWLLGVFASQSLGFADDLLLVDSTPVACAQSRETVRRWQLADAADYGWCASHSRYFWGFRLHAIFAADGTPRALALTSPKADERDVALGLLARCRRQGGEILLGDKGYAGRAFAQAVSDMDATVVRPRRRAGRSPPSCVARPTVTVPASVTAGTTPASASTAPPTDGGGGRKVRRHADVLVRFTTVRVVAVSATGTLLRTPRARTASRGLSGAACLRCEKA